MRLIGYVRVSTEEQAREGVSLDAQRQRLEAWCVAMGHELVGICSDEGVSGKLDPERRAGLAEVLRRLRERRAEGLLVVKLDRLSRVTRDLLDLVSEVERRGWVLASVSEQIDTSTAHGRFVVTILAGLAAMEREQVAERTRDALAEIRRQGRGCSRFTPFGWMTEDGGHELPRREPGAGPDRRLLVMDPDEQRALEVISMLRAEGLGVRRISSRLSALGETHPRTGNRWNPRGVERAMKQIGRG